VNSQQAAHQSGRPGAVPPFETRAEPKAWLAGDDVLMLTDLIEEPKPGDAPPPIPLPRAFDGTKAVVRWQVFHDSGRQWTDARTIADTEDASDNPILVADRSRVYLSWREIARVAYADPRRLFRADGTLVPIVELDEDAAGMIAAIEVDEDGRTTRVRMWDKNQALEKALKYLGLYERENTQRSENLSLQVVLVGAPTNERE
jgi:hypothetical protein